ncbi:MAG TPA: hypothetical protein VGI10_24510 [Polyangiaceae bacterium]|jgi:hypothetical protein
MNAAARRFAWVLNLDAELELARPGFKGHSPPARLLEQLAQYGAGARALLGPRDRLVADGLVNPAECIGRAWCPTPSAVRTLRASRVEPEPHPAPELLRRVNHRSFAHELARGLPEQRYLEDSSELRTLLERAERPWLMKRPLSFAGRGQLRARGELSQKEWAWVDASLRQGGLIVEPLVTPTLELSLHGFVWRDGRHELGRVCVQDVSERGVYRAIRLAQPDELTAGETSALFACGERVAHALFAAGYFGPFGVDAFRYELDGRSDFCALSELNARYTMGFAVGFPRHPSELFLG